MILVRNLIVDFEICVGNMFFVFYNKKFLVLYEWDKFCKLMILLILSIFFDSNEV